MALVEIICPQCGVCAYKPSGAVNRARRAGAPVYCGRECAGLARRSGESLDEKKARKAAYDKLYRAKNADRLRVEKAAYYQQTKNPEKERLARRKRAHLHAEYCRRPEYKKWKREYDRRHRAKKQYGDFADCFLLTQEIRQECLSQASDYEIRLSAGTLNKSNQRKRDYVKSHGNCAEIGALGDIE